MIFLRLMNIPERPIQNNAVERNTKVDRPENDWNNNKGRSVVEDNKDKNPYIYALKYSDFFIVTSDSTSMISECAFTGKPIYVFNLPFKRKSMRLERFHREFSNLNITKPINNKINLHKWNYKNLDESKRIASILKERIIKA